MTSFSTVVNTIRGDIAQLKKKAKEDEKKAKEDERKAKGGEEANNDSGAIQKSQSESSEAPQEVEILDSFQVDFGSSAASAVDGDTNSKGEGVEKEETKEESSSEDDNEYMELFVHKELKDKIEPILETLLLRKTEFERLDGKVNVLDKQVEHVDMHYNEVAKAMLTKQGIVLDKINAANILRELKRISDKESKAMVRIKRDQSSVSPDGRAYSPRKNETDTATNYIKKLATVA